MSLTGARYEKTAGVAQLSQEGRERLNAIPGVEDAATTCCLPIEGQFGLPFTIVGRPVDPAKGEPGAGWMNASPDYYKLFRIPILRGREFNEHDTASAPGVVLINEAFEKQYFPKENPIGQQINVGGGMGPPFEEPPRQIVGVVGNTHDGGLGARARRADDRSRRAGQGRLDGTECAHFADDLGGSHTRRPAPVCRPGDRTIARRERRVSGGACSHHG